jgi:hypothetical protein
MNSGIHAKKAPSYDFGILAVISFGRKCAGWAEHFPSLTGVPSVEILIIHDAVADIGAAISQLESPGFNMPYRFLIVDDALPLENFTIAGAKWVVSAPGATSTSSPKPLRD